MKKLLLSLVVALLNVVAVNAQWNPVVRVSYTLPGGKSLILEM